MAVQTTYYNQVDVLTGTATSTAGAATINAQTGFVTTEALVTAAGATYTFVLTNNLIKAASIVNFTVGKGTATTGGLVPIFATNAAGSTTVIFQNVTLAAVNGTVNVSFSVFNVV